jgi:hypothetical protein
MFPPPPPVDELMQPAIENILKPALSGGKSHKFVLLQMQGSLTNQLIN